MDAEVLREDMVDGVELALDEVDEDVAVAMREVPRREFVADQPYANRDGREHGTRVLAPATAARLVAALDVEAGRDVLVVGAGVGYTAALLAELAGDRHVHAIDIARRVVYAARENLGAAGYDGVLVDRADGARGLPSYAPFDRILVEAAAVRPPRALLEQLTDDGRLVIPVGNADQTLVALEAPDAGGNDEPEVVERFGPVAFDPLLVEGEQSDGVTRNRTEREDAEFARQGYFARTGWEYDWVDWDQRL